MASRCGVTCEDFSFVEMTNFAKIVSVINTFKLLKSLTNIER
ncbi:hypothetical protein NU08_0205 [Flavobacterium anhuiense]|uniref:Uncharacterized protein n=1 Tax=Flavobacterium anhuiense TaxID=459526 RepID=A0A444W502_9FLAO|nr:hypothetical protein NU08_0205 [Flavobacterium anhuiense]